MCSIQLWENLRNWNQKSPLDPFKQTRRGWCLVGSAWFIFEKNVVWYTPVINQEAFSAALQGRLNPAGLVSRKGFPQLSHCCYCCTAVLIGIASFHTTAPVNYCESHRTCSPPPVIILWHHHYNNHQGLPSLDSAIENLDSLLEEMAKVGSMKMTTGNENCVFGSRGGYF